MFSWLQRILCLIAIFGLLDGHLMVFQGVAWIDMLQDRAPVRGMSEAVNSTFSGDEPCALCSAIQEKRQEKEEKSPIPASDPSVKYFPVSHTHTKLFAPAIGQYLNRVAGDGDRALSRSDAPLSPPPQVLGSFV